MEVLEYAFGREIPVGPPWMTTRSGYFFPAWNPIGLCRTPSIVAPSWLFHDTTSSALFAHFAVCAVMSVSLRGSSLVATRATWISGRVDPSCAENAAHCPSGVRLNPDPIHCSDGAYFFTALVAGSML